MKTWYYRGEKAAIRTTNAVILLAVALLLCVPTVGQALPNLNIVEFRFVIPWTPISPGVYDGVMEVRMENSSATDGALNVSATLMSSSPVVQILDGSTYFGTIAAASSAWSIDPFGIRWGTSSPLNPSYITWYINFTDAYGASHESIVVQQPTFPALPEPGTSILLSIGLCGVMWLRAQRRR